ncbi:glutamine-hydrolyzing GMP synthase [Candidatus Micrarchaeota archaeon]|nr:glutamine-hydrolyzing GMP synthase [Candidatus Micrarchaeota archaeon]
MILVVDNGSQYTHLIKRNCRDLDFEAEIVNSKAKYIHREIEVKIKNAQKIILSGGPSSVYTDPPNLSSQICNMLKEGMLETPILGICYGQQMIAYIFGAKVAKGKSAEYGMGELTVDDEDILFKGLPKKFRVWVSHFDEVKELPKDFIRLAHSETCEIEAMRHKTKPIFGVQFHPEVWHTENGEKIIENFLKS